MNKDKNIWIGGIAVLVIAALLLWWIVARQPLSSTTDGMNTATTTTTSASQTGAKSDAAVPVINKIDRSTMTVSAVVAGLSGTSDFNALFKSTGVSATLSATGKYTIFVPTDGSFSQLPAGTLQNMTVTEKKRLIQYHIVSGRLVDVSAEISGTIDALSGDALNFSFGQDKIPLVNSAIVINEYTAKNGIVYLIDNVLLPPKKPQGSL